MYIYIMGKGLPLKYVTGIAKIGVVLGSLFENYL